MKKAIVLLILMWLLIVMAAHIRTYPDGFYVELPQGHWCGLEIAPTFGTFCDVT